MAEVSADHRHPLKKAECSVTVVSKKWQGGTLGGKDAILHILRVYLTAESKQLWQIGLSELTLHRQKF